MTNLEVAQAYVENALAYGWCRICLEKDTQSTCTHRTDVEVARALTIVALDNLEYIQRCLEEPELENQDHDWEDFK